MVQFPLARILSAELRVARAHRDAEKRDLFESRKHPPPPGLRRGKGKKEKTKNPIRQDLQDVPDEMQGSLETLLGRDPKAEPWEQWETLEHKNKLAHICASRFPLFQAIQPSQFLEYLRNLRIKNLRPGNTSASTILP